MTTGSQPFACPSLRRALLGAMLLAIGAATPAAAVSVRATVNSHLTGINAIGGTIIAVGPQAPLIDYSGTDISALGGANPYDESSFMANGCKTGTSLCNDVHILIGGYIDIDTAPGFATVAPRIDAQDVATFIFSAAGTLELNLDTKLFWGENPLSGLPGAGISRYSFGEWLVTGPNGFTFGPSRNDATGEFALAEVLSFDLAPGTYQLFSPAVSIFLCAESPADGFCGATSVPAPPSLALFAAGLLGLLGLRASRRDNRGRSPDGSLAQVVTRAASSVMRARPARCRAAAALAVCVVCAVGASNAQAASVHLANIVPVATAVNDFELAPEFVVSTWSQQGVRATQLAGDNDIWLASGFGNGSRSWYPNAGDEGWTRIALDGGNNFDAVSFFGGSGWLSLAQTLYFELADDGVVVLSGTLDASFTGSWFGFAGGDFDEVNIRASQGVVTGLLDCPSGGVVNGECNFAWVDDIRVGAAEITTPVPLPSTLGLMVFALALLKRVTARS